MLSILFSFAIATALAVFVHGSSRRFVRNRLRYVDAVQKAVAPWIAGGAVFLVAALFTALPFVGLGTALTAALAAGTGVAAGARDIRRGTSPVVYGPYKS